MTTALDIRRLLTGGDRRSIADSNQVRRIVEDDPSLVGELAALTKDENWLIVQRALDLLEKLAQEHRDWIEPHKRIFIGPLANSDKWEIRLQIMRALPLFQWTPAQLKRVEDILRDNVSFPQTFVRAWALDGLATLAERQRRPQTSRGGSSEIVRAIVEQGAAGPRASHSSPVVATLSLTLVPLEQHQGCA